MDHGHDPIKSPEQLGRWGLERRSSAPEAAPWTRSSLYSNPLTTRNAKPRLAVTIRHVKAKRRQFAAAARSAKVMIRLLVRRINVFAVP